MLGNWLVLVVIFAVLTAVGAYWAAAQLHSRRLAVILVVVVLVFFVGLYLGLEWLVVTYGPAAP